MHAVSAEDAWRSISADREIERDRQLRETIAIIQGLTELLLDSEGELTEATARHALESIHRHTLALRDLVSF